MHSTARLLTVHRVTFPSPPLLGALPHTPTPGDQLPPEGPQQEAGALGPPGRSSLTRDHRLSQSQSPSPLSLSPSAVISFQQAVSFTRSFCSLSALGLWNVSCRRAGICGCFVHCWNRGTQGPTRHTPQSLDEFRMREAELNSLSKFDLYD